MSGANKDSVYTSRNNFTNRARAAVETFSELTAKMATLDTVLLLLGSNENDVLKTVFKHITEFVRQQEENVAVIREKNVLDLLLDKEFFMQSEDPLIRRFALYLVTAILESINILEDMDTVKVRQIQSLCVAFYLKEDDDFCLEYLCVCINKCLEDPQAALEITDNKEFLEKFFVLTAGSENPDVVLNSIEALHKMLQVQSTTAMNELVADPLFPLDRILCDLTNEYLEVRNAALKVTKILIADTSETSPFADRSCAVNVLQQLTRAFCTDPLAPNLGEIIDVLSVCMQTEEMVQILFEQNLFDNIVQNLDTHSEKYPLETKCRILQIFTEIARYPQFLPRLHGAKVTDQLLKCLIDHNVTSTHVLSGLNRSMQFTAAANEIVDSFSKGLLDKLTSIILDKELPTKVREKAAELILDLLVFAFHKTTAELMALNFPEMLADIFSQGRKELSIDLILTLLSIVENLAHNNEYRQKLAETGALIHHIVVLLTNSFSTAIVATNIFRCLCTLIDEEPVRLRLIKCKISSSVKRGLKSLANLLKTSVTNFIMQTARFPEFVREYIDASVLEVLILHQKHAFCVPTWGPATEAILSKCPTLKFSIRKQLGFTDLTNGDDFLVSKRKFEDFRDFRNILKEEVSPLRPILVVNFNRISCPPELVVKVPTACLKPEDGNPDRWCYCRNPGDPELPALLDTLNMELESQGLVENTAKVQRRIDFDNIANRAKIVAKLVAMSLSTNIKQLDLNTTEECSSFAVKCHLRELNEILHCNFIPLGIIRTGCQFERAVLFKALSDQIGLPCTLKGSVDGKLLFNEVPLPVQIDHDIHCDKKTMEFMPWRMLRPTHVVDLMYNVGALYPLQSRQALQYLRLY